MNTRYSYVSLITGNSISFYYGNPMDMETKRLEAEMRLRNRGKNEPNKRPPRKPGDVYIIIGIVFGAAIGGLLGSLFGSLAILEGMIAGGILGAVVVNAIKKLPHRKKTKKEEHPQSPFIS